MFKRIMFVFCILSGLITYSQDDKPKRKANIKTFVSFDFRRNIITNNNKYFGIIVGANFNCKFRAGFGFNTLIGRYSSDNYSVDQSEFPNAANGIRSDIKTYTVFGDPVYYNHPKITISSPIHLGISSFKSEYKNQGSGYTQYLTSNPFFAEAMGKVTFRFAWVFHLGVAIGYRHSFSDNEIIKNEFNSPVMAISLKIGGCRPKKEKKKK